jgi:chromosome segregation ATPase
MTSPLDHESYRHLLAALDDEHAKVTASTGNINRPLGKLREALGELTRVLDEQAANLDTVCTSTRTRFEGFREYLLAEAGADGGAAERIAELEQERTRLQESVRTGEARLTQVSQELTERKAAADAARSRITELETALNEARHEAAQQRERAEALDRAARDRQSEESSARDAANELRMRVDHLQAEADSAKRTTQRAEEERNQTRQELDALRTELSDWRERAEKANALTRERDRLLHDAETQQRQIQVHAQRIQELEQDLAARVPKDKALALEEAARIARERADLAEQRLQDETAKGTKSVLAQQLAEALREAEQAREELHTLRRKLGRAEGAPAAAPAAAKQTPPPPAADASEEESLERIRAAAKTLGRKKTMGEILVTAGILDKQTLDYTLEVQRNTPNTHLGALLIEQGLANETIVAQGLASQCDVDFIHFDDGAMDPEAAALITRRLALQHTCIPIHADDTNVTLVMANPLDLVAIEDVERAANRKATPVVSTPAEIRAAIEKYYWEPE